MSNILDTDSFENYFQLNFVEFIEFLGRLALTAYEHEDLVPGEKIEKLLDLIFSQHGLIRNPVKRYAESEGSETSNEEIC